MFVVAGVVAALVVVVVVAVVVAIASFKKKVQFRQRSFSRESLLA